MPGAPGPGGGGVTGRVCAVVLTYNRRELLRECLEAIGAQTRPPDHVLVVDNAGTDGTAGWLPSAFPGVEVLRLEHNAGSAGGFHACLEAASRRGCGWVWLMDDDVIAGPGALAALLDRAGRLRDLGPGDLGFVCSRVVGVNGASMNVPEIDTRPGANLYPDWETQLALGVVRLRRATFVSILLPRETIEAVGLPLREMYIFGEDTEYTLRITRTRPGYLVGGSVVVHRRALQTPLDLALEQDPARLPYHFHRTRNDVYVARRYLGRRQVLGLYARNLRRLPRLLRLPQGPRRAALTLRALAAGAVFRPREEPPAAGSARPEQGAHPGEGSASPPEGAFGPLRRQVLRGGTFLVARQGVSIVLSLVSVLLVTRMIGPAAFGTYATAAGLLGYLVLFGQLGVGVFLVRRAQDPSPRAVDVAFTLLLGMGVALALVAAALAPSVAAWLHNPALAPVAAVMLLGLPLQIVLTVPTARLERQLDYRAVAGIDLAAQLGYVLVALPLALGGLGVWAAVAGWWAQLAVSAAGYTTLGRYRPRLAWDAAEVRDMLNYGVGYSSSLWLWQARTLVNPLVVGHLLGPAAVAYVSLAVRLVEMLAVVKMTAFRVAVAAFGRMQRDLGGLTRAINRAMPFQVLAVGLPLSLFSLFGGVLIARLFGPRWAPVMNVFPFVALGALVNSVFNLHSSALYVLRRNWEVTLLHVVHMLLFGLGAALLVPRLGLGGYGWAEVIALPGYAVIQAAARRYVGPVDPELALLWAAALGCALFTPLLGWPALLPLLVLAALPATRAQVVALVGGLREPRPQAE